MPSKEHLTFESQTPAFLRRLRGEDLSGPSGEPRDPDRHATPQIRAKRSRNPEEEDDDPVYVDAETGEVVAKTDVEELSGKKEAKVERDPFAETSDAAELKHDEETHKEQPKQGVAGVGVGLTGRKRDRPKVIGAEHQDADDEPSKNASKARGKADAPSSEDKKGVLTKVKKKSKKIKLSFDDDG